MKLKLQLEYSLIISIGIISILGSLMIYSITGGNFLFIKHIFCLLIGWLIFFLAIKINYRIWLRFSKLIYIGIIFLLILVLLTEPIRAAKSWFSIGYFSFQPAEFAKFAVILLIADYLANKKNKLNSIEILISSLLLAVPLLLILKQPDLGTAVIFLPAYFIMLYIAGINRFKLLIMVSLVIFTACFTLLLLFLQIKYSRTLFEFIKLPHLLLLISIFCILIACLLKLLNINKVKYIFLFAGILVLSIFISSLVDNLLADYQKKRLLVFLDTGVDPLGVGYSIIQSKITIGSGMIWGKGILQGAQGKLGFLPECLTDFIFSVLAEELGFIGTSIIIFLFFLINYKSLKIAYNCNNTFARLLSCGLVTIFITQVFLNISVTLGILPTTGVPLPLISYGGSSLIITFFSLGIILSIQRHK